MYRATFISATTLLLAAVFYQQSGGTEFEPWQRPVPAYVTTAPSAYSASRAEAPEHGVFLAQAGMRPRAATAGGFVSPAHAADRADGPGVQLASAAGMTDAGLDPVLDGLHYATATPASFTPAAFTPETPQASGPAMATRGMLPAATAAATLAPDETQAVIRGTLPEVASAATGATTGAAKATAATDLRQVAGDWVNLRQGPGTGHPVVDTLRRGTEVEVTGENAGWLQLTVPGEGTTGWMAASLVTSN